MTRVVALAAAAALILSGCFLFNNPYDTTPTISFQIAVTSALYGGTYVWNPTDNAYEATVGGSRYYVYLDSLGRWCLGSILNQVYTGAVCYAATPPFMALPLATGTYWTLSDKLTSINDSAAGISAQGSQPDAPVIHTQVLQVAFQTSPAASAATYQWLSSNNQAGSPNTVLGTGSTYPMTVPDKFTWIRVVVTPTDGAGNAVGSAVTSPPVYVSS